MSADLCAAVAEPFRELYTVLVAKGMKPPMARLNLARKMASITLLVWQKRVRFDAEHLNGRVFQTGLRLSSDLRHLEFGVILSTEHIDVRRVLLADSRRAPLLEHLACFSRITSYESRFFRMRFFHGRIDVI
jgi:hypothetical protein